MFGWSDGTTLGTAELPGQEVGPTSAQLWATEHGTAYFLSETTDGLALFESDGTAEGTTVVQAGTDAQTGFDAWLGNLGEISFFTSWGSGVGVELWATNGTAEGTALIRDIDPGPDGAFGFGAGPNAFAALGDQGVFVAEDTEHGAELWVSDGSFGGTRLLVDLVEGPVGSAPRELTEFGDGVFFVATVPGFGTQIWRTDGTAEGTVMVTDLGGGAATEISELYVHGNTLYFSAFDDPAVGGELYRTDGEGTVELVTDLYPGHLPSWPMGLTSLGEPTVLRRAHGCRSRALCPRTMHWRVLHARSPG